MDAKIMEVQLKFLLDTAAIAYPTSDLKYTIRNITRDDSWLICMTSDSSLNEFFFAQGTGKTLEEALDNIKPALLNQISKSRDDLTKSIEKFTVSTTKRANQLDAAILTFGPKVQND